MTTVDIMQDTAYRPVLFAIESRILLADRTAQEDGIKLTDSQVRSVIHRVRKSPEGAHVDIPREPRRDQILAELQNELADIGPGITTRDLSGREQPFPTREWQLCLQCVEESVRRHSTGSGSRGYLEFIADYLP